MRCHHESNTFTWQFGATVNHITDYKRKYISEKKHETELRVFILFHILFSTLEIIACVCVHACTIFVDIKLLKHSNFLYTLILH